MSGASQLLRPGLLDGVTLLLAVETRAGAFAASVRDACGSLGGETLVATREDVSLAESAEIALAQCGRLDILFVDAASLFTGAAASGEPRDGLMRCLGDTWAVTRTVANAAFLARERGGRIVYLAPAASDGTHAQAARAGLENLARTLSIEWARHAVTTVAITPGEDTAPGDVAALTAYLASPAGSYFSGCLLDLSGR